MIIKLILAMSSLAALALLWVCAAASKRAQPPVSDSIPEIARFVRSQYEPDPYLWKLLDYIEAQDGAAKSQAD